jgi:membrane protease YdiL (CAAX protease family)
MSKLVSVAAAGALALGAVAASPAAPAAAALSDTYQVCLPSTCLLTAGASVRGTMNWNLDLNTFRATNNAFPFVYARFTQYTGGVASGTVIVPIPRGGIQAGSNTVRPTTDSLGIVLCATAFVTPSCASTVVSR